MSLGVETSPDKVRAMVRSEIDSLMELRGFDRVRDEDVETNLVEAGYVDSLGLLAVIASIEKTFALSLDFEDLDVDAFQTLEGLTRTICEGLSRAE